jgi:phage gp29-like protein
MAKKNYSVKDRLEHKDNINTNVATLSRKIVQSKYFNLKNPDEILTKANLKPKHLIEIYNDPQVTSAMELRKSQVQKLKWDIDRGIENEFFTTWIREIMKTWNMPKLISGIIDSRAWGYSVFEYAWIETEKQLRIVDVVQKPSYWFEFDSNSQLRFMSQDKTSIGERCTQLKFLLVQNNSTYENPYGNSLLSKCYWQVRFKKDTIKLWSTFIEKYGMPFFLGHAAQTSTTVITKFVDMLDALRQDGVAVVGREDIVEKLSGNDVASKEIFESFVQTMDAQISKVILNHASAMDATQGQLGNTSKALTTLDVLAVSDKELVEHSINQIIKLLISVNFGDVEHIPNFEMYEVSDVDLDLANRDKILKEVGVAFTKDYMMTSYGLKETDFSIVATAPTPTGPTGNAFSEAETKLNNSIDEMFAPFVSILEQGKNYEEVKAKLYDKFNNLDDNEINTIMTKLITQAEKGLLNGTTIQAI